MHLNRTAEIGLSASFAHEVSQPLVAISLNAERAEDLLRADPPEVGKLKEIVTAITQANSLAMNVIRNLHNLLKRKSEIQDCDLNAVIADSMQLLSPEANRRNIDLRVNVIQRALLVRADPVHLEQVVLNLVTNAMDAMTESGVDVRKLTIQTALPGESSVEVSVSDSGPGIPEHKLSEIFDTFYTTKEEGTGLGLSVARTIIERPTTGRSGPKTRPGAVPYSASPYPWLGSLIGNQFGVSDAECPPITPLHKAFRICWGEIESMSAHRIATPRGVCAEADRPEAGRC